MHLNGCLHLLRDSFARIYMILMKHLERWKYFLSVDETGESFVPWLVSVLPAQHTAGPWAPHAEIPHLTKSESKIFSHSFSSTPWHCRSTVTAAHGTTSTELLHVAKLQRQGVLFPSCDGQLSISLKVSTEGFVK